MDSVGVILLGKMLVFTALCILRRLTIVTALVSPIRVASSIMIAIPDIPIVTVSVVLIRPIKSLVSVVILIIALVSLITIVTPICVCIVLLTELFDLRS